MYWNSEWRVLRERNRDVARATRRDERQTAARAREERWVPWFAWYPIRLTAYVYGHFWLEHVDRRFVRKVPWSRKGGRYEYRDIPE